MLRQNYEGVLFDISLPQGPRVTLSDVMFSEMVYIQWEDIMA